MAYFHRKILSTSLVTKKMQIKNHNETSQHLGGLDSKNQVITSVDMNEEKLESSIHYWWGCKMKWLLLKIVWHFLKKLSIEFPYNPAIPLLCIYPIKMKT